MWEVLKEAKVKRKRVVWLDMATTYGAIPHALIAKAL
jgi:hypothetical protein